MADKNKITDAVVDTPPANHQVVSADELKDVKIQPQVLREVILALQANLHHSNANTKRRGEVRGGGRKPWRQKGTGRARVGSIRSPLWRSGGITFGPLKTKNYQQSITSAVRRQALLGALRIKLQAGKVSTMNLNSSAVKTKAVAAQLSGTLTSASALVVVSDPLQARPLRNIAGIQVVTANRLNTLDIISARQIIFVNNAYTDLKTKLGI